MSVSRHILSQFRKVTHDDSPRAISRTLIQTVKVFAFCHLFAEYLLTVKATYGPSMLPTINVRDDWVFISKMNRRGKNVEVGDIVSLTHPMVPDMGVVKRVLGMPGDFVLREAPGLSGGANMIQVNQSKSPPPLKMLIGRFQVPKGHCWVVGDNLDSSRDSRMYGPQPLALVKGKVLAKFRVEGRWPWQWRIYGNWLRNTLELPLEQDSGLQDSNSST